jgi:hypothetical protein
MGKPKDKTIEQIEILQIQKAEFKLYLFGTSALYMNRMAKKAREQLLLPAKRKNRTALESTQKHDPPAEYRDAIYRCRDAHAPTLVHMPNGAFKGALANAALRLPGATKAEIGQLVQVVDATVHIYGVPYLHMGVVRNSDPRHTPDIRTRAIFPQWACEITVRHVISLITGQSVVNLAAGAGMIVGIGDGRVEKGKFDFGQWELVSPDDKRWREIVAKQGRKAQEAAMQNPIAFDEDTEELLSWYHAEVGRREGPSAHVIAGSKQKAAKNGRRARAQ